MPELDKQEIDRLVRGYFEARVKEANDTRVFARYDPTFDWEGEIKGAQENLERCRAELAEGPYREETLSAARGLLEPKRHGNVSPADDEFFKLCDGVLRAKREAYRIYTALLQGKLEEIDPRDPLFAGIDTTALPPIPGEEPEEPSGPPTVGEDDAGNP